MGGFLHRRERRLQLVRYVRDEVFLHLIDLNQPNCQTLIFFFEAKQANTEVGNDSDRCEQRYSDHYSSILYVFSLFRMVFTSRPSWRAASALLCPVFSRVFRINSRSASAAVMPKGSTIFVEDSALGLRR